MYVYFIKALSTPVMLKIGKAKDPEFRRTELQTGCPFELRLIGTLKCKSGLHALGVEQQLHRLFRREKHRGEWFKYRGHMPYVLSEIINSRDSESVNETFGWAIARARRYEGKKKTARIADQSEFHSEIDLQSLDHLRSIRAEGQA